MMPGVFSRDLFFLRALQQLETLSSCIRHATSFRQKVLEKCIICKQSFNHSLYTRKLGTQSGCVQTYRCGSSPVCRQSFPLHYCLSKHIKLKHAMGLQPNGILLTFSNVEVTQIRGIKMGKSRVSQHLDEHINPIDRLQQHVAVPLLNNKDVIFKPSLSEVAAGQQLFIPRADHKIEFLQSAMLEEQLPVYDLPEVAFIGRSNVGKSTLISMLLSHTDVLVKCSKHPGHTRLLNFFQAGKNFTLVDMPGYGFNMPEYYASLVEKFLATRRKLSRTFILVDGSVGMTEYDVVGLNMVEEFHVPYVIVMTKIDKGKPATLIKNLMSVQKYRDQTNYCFPQPFLVSSTKGEGIPLLQAFIAYVTGNLSVKGL